MLKAIHSTRHARLVELLAAARREAGMTQSQVAAALGRHQPFIANIESGERRIDVVEFLNLADVIGVDPLSILAEVRKTPKSR